MSKRKFAIITTLKPKTLKMRLKFLYKSFLCYVKLFFYSMLKNEKEVSKYCKKLYHLSKNYNFPNFLGHMGILGSLIRGFKQLNVHYTINEINKETETIIVLWTDKEELKKLENLKIKNNVKQIIMTPECDLWTSGLRFEFAQHELIDKVLVASAWVKNLYENRAKIPSGGGHSMQYLTSEYQNCNDKIQPFASGVEVSEKILENKFTKSCICYYKRLPVNNAMTEMLENKGIKVNIVEYGNYEFEKYMDLLKNVDFVIYYQDNIETQGLAIAEAWAKNKPTFIKYNRNEWGGETCPYLTDYTGLFYKDLTELEAIVDKYLEQKQLFLDKFQPQQWTIENMSDKSTAKDLLKIMGY